MPLHLHVFWKTVLVCQGDRSQTPDILQLTTFVALTDPPQLEGNLIPRGGVIKPKPKPLDPVESPPKPKSPTTITPEPKEPIGRPGDTTSGDTSALILTPDQYKVRGQNVQNALTDAIRGKAVDKTIKPEGTFPSPGRCIFPVFEYTFLNKGEVSHVVSLVE
jgi:hypothetical protein